MSIHRHNFDLPSLPLLQQRPTDRAIEEEMRKRPGLGRMQAYRQVQMRMAFQSLERSNAGRRWLSEREARRHVGC